MREVARESFRCEGRCSKPIPRIASCIGVSLRQVQRIAKSAVERGVIGREDLPGRSSCFWLRSDALRPMALATSGKARLHEGRADELAGVTRRVRGDSVARGAIFFSQSESELTNNSDERNLRREKHPAGLFGILDVDRRRLRNREKQGAKLVELRYEEAGSPQGSGELVEFLDATLKFLKGEDIRYPKVLLLRLRQIRRGEFTPRGLAGFDVGQDTGSETWRAIAGLRNKLRPGIACLWQNFTRGMADIPFPERVRHFLGELDIRHIELKPSERAALKDLAAPANQSYIASEGDNSSLHAPASDANHAVASSDFEEG